MKKQIKTIDDLLFALYCLQTNLNIVVCRPSQTDRALIDDREAALYDLSIHHLKEIDFKLSMVISSVSYQIDTDVVTAKIIHTSASPIFMALKGVEKELYYYYAGIIAMFGDEKEEDIEFVENAYKHVWELFESIYDAIHPYVPQEIIDYYNNEGLGNKNDDEDFM